MTYKKKVNNRESSLDESNYNLFIVPVETVKTVSELPLKTTIKKKAKEKIVFTNQPNAVAERKKSSDRPRNKPGVTSFAKEAKTQLECFQLFMTATLLNTFSHLSKHSP